MEPYFRPDYSKILPRKIEYVVYIFDCMKCNLPIARFDDIDRAAAFVSQMDVNVHFTIQTQEIKKNGT